MDNAHVTRNTDRSSVPGYETVQARTLHWTPFGTRVVPKSVLIAVYGVPIDIEPVTGPANR